MAERLQDLGTAELDVLKALWETGPAPVREVMAHLHHHGRKVAYTTVQTLLTRLEQKRYVVSDKSDVAHVFRARVSRERVSRTRLKTLVSQLYDGATGPLVLQLVKSGRLTTEEISELHALIEKLDREE